MKKLNKIQPDQKTLQDILNKKTKDKKSPDYNIEEYQEFKDQVNKMIPDGAKLK